MPFRRTSRFLIGAGVAGLAAMTAVTSVWVTYRADAAREVLAEEVRSLLGRELVTRGRTEVSLLPRLRLSLRDVSLEPSSDGDAPPLTAEELRVSLRLLPILTGRFSVKDFVLVRPTIRVRVDEAGRPNWGLPGADASRRAGSFGDLRIEDGTIAYEDARLGLGERVAGVNARLSWPNLVQPASLNARAVWRGTPFELNASADAPLALGSGGTSPARLTIGSTLLKASFNGRASLMPSLFLDGEAIGTMPAVRGMLRWAGYELDHGSTFGAAALRGRLKLEDRRVQLAAAPVELDGNRGEGALELSFGGARPRLIGTLDFQRLDLGPYLVSADGIAPDFDSSLLSRIEADLRLSAGNVTIGRVSLGQLAASAVLRDNLFEAMVGDAEFYGGRLKASVSIAPWHHGIRGQAKGTIVRADAQKALAAVSGFTRVSGNGALTFAVSGEGSTWKEMLGSLDGQAELKLRNGSISGLPVPQVREVTGGRTVLAFDPVGTAPFETIESAVVFSDGEARTDRLLLEGSAVRLAGYGTVSLPSLAMMLRGQATILRKGTDGERVPAFEIPLTVAGTLTQPLLVPEESGLSLPAGLEPSIGDVVRTLTGQARRGIQPPVR